MWTRPIKSERSILSSLLKTHGTSLNGEALTTLMTEVEAVLNSQPLMTERLSDTNSLNPICLSNILTMKTKVVMPPLGEFGLADIYYHKQRRGVQHTTEEFWNRWRREFLVSLYQCQKWSKNKMNLQTGDIVLLKDDSHHRNYWPMAGIAGIFADKHGHV